MNRHLCYLALILTAWLVPALTARAQGTAFTYQGRLVENGAPANGMYDLRFTMHDTSSGGNPVGAVVTNIATRVNNGLFTVTLDFGADVFTGPERWLELGVKSNGVAGAFTSLNPRQPITGAPYAIKAATADAVPGLRANTNAGSITLGLNTIASGAGSTAAGVETTASGFGATALGLFGTAGGVGSVGLGYFASAGGDYSVALGSSVFANAPFSLAAGHWATANHRGSFVWGDSQDQTFASTSSNQFLVRASGGVGINTNNPNGAALAVQGNVKVNGSIGTPGNQPLEFYLGGQRALRLELAPSGQDEVNVIGGSSHNAVGPGTSGATIGGGGGAPFFGSSNLNYVSGSFGTISGGGRNTIQAGQSATIGGGSGNTIHSAYWASIGGGSGNRILGYEGATIGGGLGNRINAGAGTVSGGNGNIISTNAFFATIGGGSDNTVQTNAQFATIPGGYLNSATLFAFAAGRRAKANHTGAFVWADSTDADYASTGANQVLFRAGGGLGINTTAPEAALHVGSRAIVNGSDFWDVNNTEGDFRVGSATHRFKIGVAQGGGGAGDVWMRAHGGTSRLFVKTPGGTTFFSNEGQSAGVTLAPGGGAWTSVSDRNAKENFRPVDAADVLAKVVALPISRWNYKSQDSNVQHLGPMAQDFKAAFDLGESDTGITTVDADGVALAAIQGLNKKLEETRAENAELKARLEKLERLLQAR
jgi:trimeric autotransporter adhesin